jgi:outer membrane protein OmpA-like peptidoglycan-associated protein
VIISLLVGCGQQPSQVPVRIVVTASATRNEPGPVLAAPDRALLSQAGATSTDAVSYVVNPGNGQPAEVTLTPRRPDGQVDYGPDRGNRLAANLDAVQQLLGREAASRPFDLIADIAAARRVTAGPATLLIISSGLSTAGALDLRQVGWGANPRTVAAQLRRGGQLPSLAGWRVTFSGLGDTAGDQPALPLPQRAMLTRLWLAICRATGAASCGVDGITRPGPPSQSTKPVPIVPIPQVTSVRGPHGSAGVIVPADAFFAFNSARLLPGADRVLSPLAGRARARHLAVSVTGYASPDGGTAAYNNALSRRRAAAVAARLIALGVPSRQIAAVTGKGTAGRLRSACYRQGRLDETVCAQLRRVVITLSSPAAVMH